jgi:predicted N-acyltransferase
VTAGPRDAGFPAGATDARDPSQGPAPVGHHVTLRTYVVDSLADVSAATWDTLAAPAPLYQSRPWLRWAEAHHDLPTWYVLAKDGDGRLVGAVVVYLMRRVPNYLTRWYDPIRMFLTPHCTHRGAIARWYPVLLVGGCSGYHSGILHDPSLDATARAAVTRALLDRCRDIAEEHRCGSVAFMYAPMSACAEFAAGWREPSHIIPTSAEADLTLAPAVHVFDDYLAGFPQPRRVKLRKEIAAFTAAGGRVGTYRLGAVRDRLAPLLGAHQRKYGDRVTDEQLAHYLEQQDEYLGGSSTVFVDEQDGDIRGFALCYQHHDTVYVRASGVDQERAAPYAHFNLVYYAPIGYAIAHGFTRVSFGMGSYQTKVLRGAALSALGSVVVAPENLEPAWAEALGRPAPQAVAAGLSG